MLGICFEHEKRGWMQDQWSFLFSNFGVTEIWEINQGNSDFEIYQTVTGIASYDELPQRPLIALTPQEGRYLYGEQSLDGFVHPEDAIYIFGGSFSNLEFPSARQPDSCVYIPTVKHECFSHAAAYMTLWDRYVKRGGFG